MALLPEGFWYRSFTHKLRWIQHISSCQGAQRYSKSLNYFYFSDGFGKSLYTDTFRKRVSLFDPEASIKYYFNADNSIKGCRYLAQLQKRLRETVAEKPRVALSFLRTVPSFVFVLTSLGVYLIDIPHINFGRTFSGLPGE